VDVELSIEAPWPSPPDWEQHAAKAASVLARMVPALANPRLSVSLLLTDDTEIHSLNREWRGKDKPTNVLSFPMLTGAELAVLAPDGPPVLLGDIALALTTCRREAADKGIPLGHHATHLIVHGLLHLAGHDHETSDDDATAMEALETKALALMGIADPYCDAQRDQGG
jgi:probable rRNA maturation factor